MSLICSEENRSRVLMSIRSEASFDGRSSFKNIGDRAASRDAQPCTVLIAGKNKDDG